MHNLKATSETKNMLIRDMGFSARLVSTSWPLFETHCRIVIFWAFKLIIFAFSNNLSAANLKLSADSGIKLFGCMCQPRKIIFQFAKNLDGCPNMNFDARVLQFFTLSVGSEWSGLPDIFKLTNLYI